MSYKGKFSPKNPKKYLGDPTMIIFRSLWEYKCMKYFDTNPNVISWKSEETIIPYLSPLDNQLHRYFVDFHITVKTKDGIKDFLLEVKPYDQTIPPKMVVTPKKQQPTKAYLESIETYAVNEAKWNAAKEYCGKRGWKFIILTEKNCGFFDK